MVYMGQDMPREPWLVRRRRSRRRFLIHLCIGKKKLRKGGIETDGGNIFFKEYRVGVFSENEKKHEIALLYTPYGSKTSNILYDKLKLVLEFRGILDKKHIPYTEHPSREDMSRIIAREKEKLEELLLDIK